MRPRVDGTFSSTRTGLVKSSRLLTAVLLSSFAVLSLVWFVFVSGYFSVKDIQSNPLQSISSGEVASTTMDILGQGAWRPWDKANMFFIDEKQLAEQLTNRLFAEQVTVDKVYPNILRLLIAERQRSVVMVSKNQNLIIDMNGVVTGDADAGTVSSTQAAISQKSLADKKNAPIIACDLPELATAGYQVTDQDHVKTWIGAYRELTISGLRFRYLRLSEPASSSLKIVAEGGYEVIYDLGQPLGPQIETYKKFLKTKPKNQPIQEYVDVRVPGRIYVK